MTLHIVMNSPGNELSDSSIDTAIMTLASRVMQERQQGHLPGGPALELTFMLPGSRIKPGFEGMRMGGYTRAEDILYFETAVPQHIVQSGRAPEYVDLVLLDMIDNASQFFDDSMIPFEANS